MSKQDPNPDQQTIYPATLADTVSRPSGAQDGFAANAMDPALVHQPIPEQNQAHSTGWGYESQQYGMISDLAQMPAPDYGLQQYDVSSQVPPHGYGSAQNAMPASMTESGYGFQPQQHMPPQMYGGAPESDQHQEMTAQIHQPRIQAPAPPADPPVPESTDNPNPKKRKNGKPVPGCTYPGCSHTHPFTRPFAYRRHMREVHQVIIESDQVIKERASRKAMAAATPPSNDQTTPDAMKAYLEDPGRMIPTDVRQPERDRAAQQRNMMSNNLAVVQEECARLREALRRAYDELRLERARSVADLAEERRMRRAERDEMVSRHREELKAARRNALVFLDHRGDIQEICEKLTEQHEQEFEASEIRNRLELRRLEHEEKVREIRGNLNLRRVWNLVSQGG